MPVLSREEKETVISFDETPAEAVVFTYNKRWQTQLEKKLGIKPTMNNGFGGREYKVPKGRIRMPQAPKKLSAEQRRKMGQRLKNARLQKSAVSSKNNAVIKKSEGNSSGEGKSSHRRGAKSKNQQKPINKKLVAQKR